MMTQSAVFGQTEPCASFAATPCSTRLAGVLFVIVDDLWRPIRHARLPHLSPVLCQIADPRDHIPVQLDRCLCPRKPVRHIDDVVLCLGVAQEKLLCTRACTGSA